MTDKQPPPVPENRKPRDPVRMPQRSQEVAGDEYQGATPIAAALAGAPEDEDGNGADCVTRRH